MVSSQTLPQRCVFCKSSAVPLEKHLLIKIIKADSGLVFPLGAVAVCWTNISKCLLKKKAVSHFLLQAKAT